MSLWASHCMLPGPPPETTHDEPHAVLDQPPRQQAAPAVVVGRLACRRRRGRASPAVSPRQVEDLGRLGLHPEGQVVGVDAGGELLVVRVERRLVQVADELAASRAAARA